jgi:hypothetical protein
MAVSGRAPEGDLLCSGRPGAQKTAESEFLFRCYSDPESPCPRNINVVVIALALLLQPDARPLAVTCLDELYTGGFKGPAPFVHR